MSSLRQARVVSSAVLVCAASLPALAQADGELRRNALNPGSACGECHEEIHAMWQRSMHSAALSDPIFELSYMKANLETEGAAQKLCLRCHAPAAALAKDYRLVDPISRDGVTCDFCHSVVAVDLNQRDQPFRVSLDGIKRGPLGDADSPAHGVAKSTVHESAEFCAGCHEYTNDVGIPIFSTYTEWKASPQGAAGTTCQQCHMPDTPGETVVAGLTANARESINLHDISGMHSTEQVRKAATARIVAIRRQPGNGVQIEVEVANVGSGHFIPTGLPTRKLQLELVLFSDRREVGRFERVYEKRLLDAEGRPITEDHRAVLAAHKVERDTRIRPGEHRRETFHTTVPGAGSLSAELRLRYLYEPQIVLGQRISIDMAEDRSSVPR